MRSFTLKVVIGGTCLIIGLGGAHAQMHPLDPLTYEEYWTVLQTLERESRLDAGTVFYNVSLIEPDKSNVWSFEDGHELERRAKAVVGHGGDTAEAVIDLTAGALESWNVLQGAQPNWLSREFVAMGDVIKEHPDFIAGTRHRKSDARRLHHLATELSGHRGATRAAHRTCRL